MGSSLAVGLRAVPDGCAAAVVALVDQPLIGAAAVRRLIAAHAAGATVAVAAYHGQPRNPVLLARAHWPEVISLAAGTSARGRSCAPTRTWSRWSSARTPASRTTWTPRPTWPGSPGCCPARPR